MVRKVDYRDLKETLKINIWDDGSYKGKMQPSPSYVKKDRIRSFNIRNHTKKIMKKLNGMVWEV